MPTRRCLPPRRLSPMNPLRPYQSWHAVTRIVLPTPNYRPLRPVYLRQTRTASSWMVRSETAVGGQFGFGDGQVADFVAGDHRVVSQLAGTDRSGCRFWRGLPPRRRWLLLSTALSAKFGRSDCVGGDVCAGQSVGGYIAGDDGGVSDVGGELPARCLYHWSVSALPPVRAYTFTPARDTGVHGGLV